MEGFNVNDIPNLNPKVEEYLMLGLRREVDAYTQSVQGVKCMLCPFHTFSRLRNLKFHSKYHCAKSMYLADPRSQQRAVVRAYIDFCQAVVPFASGLPKENFKSSKSRIFEISPGATNFEISPKTTKANV